MKKDIRSERVARPGFNIKSRLIWVILINLLYWALCFSAVTAPVLAKSYFIDPSAGNDDNSGQSIDAAWKSLASIDDHNIVAGDEILLKRGEVWEEKLDASLSGVAGEPIEIKTYGGGSKPVIRGISLRGNHLVFEDLTVDTNQSGDDAVKVYGDHNVLRRLTIRNGLKDGIDVSGVQDLRVEGCLIHHFLGGSFSNQVDAHGIVVKRSQRITVRDTEIHHVSGDSFQADPDRDSSNLTNDLVIENCHFWTGPLKEDFNSGWLKTDHLPEAQKQYPGENAIDTKVLKSGWENIPRMRITLKNITAHGWKQDGFISNKAVFNLKEKIEATLDGITVYDCEIAFRLRGTRGNANVLIKNAVIYNCQKAIRSEDNLENLKIYNSTFGDSIDTQLYFAGGSDGTDTWDFRNNAFVEKKPDVGIKSSNEVVANSELDTVFADTETGNYHLKSGSRLIEIGETLSSVTIDRDGSIRTSPYDLGAYEFSSSSGTHLPPMPPQNLRVIE
jgi:hypothetical protein